MICFIYLGGSVKRERLGAWGMYLACNHFARSWVLSFDCRAFLPRHFCVGKWCIHVHIDEAYQCHDCLAFLFNSIKMILLAT
jgi:hypothetical protein